MRNWGTLLGAGEEARARIKVCVAFSGGGDSNGQILTRCCMDAQVVMLSCVVTAVVQHLLLVKTTA